MNIRYTIIMTRINKHLKKERERETVFVCKYGNVAQHGMYIIV
jgi:hypothetical protein